MSLISLFLFFSHSLTLLLALTLFLIHSLSLTLSLSLSHSLCLSHTLTLSLLLFLSPSRFLSVIFHPHIPLYLSLSLAPFEARVSIKVTFESISGLVSKGGGEGGEIGRAHV